MDQRGTLATNESFIEKLKQCYNTKEKVAMIVDNGGMQRVEGFIKNIHFDAQPPFFVLHDGTEINPYHVIAINGTFLSDYSEC